MKLESYQLWRGTNKAGNIDAQKSIQGYNMNVRLGMAVTSAAIFVLLDCSHVQAKKLHDSQIEAAQLKTAVTNHKHQGKAESNYTKRFHFFVNLSELNYFPVYKRSGEVEMTPDQLDVIWEKIAMELPEGTDFLIKSATFEDNNSSIVQVYLESSATKDIISKSAFINGYVEGNLTKWSVEPETAQTLKEYVDLTKWDKETGFSAAQTYLLEERPVARVTIVIEGELIDGQHDIEAYKTILDRIGTHVPRQYYVLLADGSMATEILADLPLLNELYNEKKVIQIIPDLSDK